MSDALDEVLAEAVSLGFLSSRPAVDHRRHADAFAALVGGRGPIVDLGTGGGVPGLVLATAFPQRRVVLVERGTRKAAFLEASAVRLGLRRVEVEACDVEPAAVRHRAVAEFVTARSFGPPATTAECAAPFLAVAGRLVVSEPPGGDATRWPPEGLATVGLAVSALHAGPPAFAVLVRTGSPTVRLPRSAGAARRHPLF